ncbi:hypothetical protein MBM_09522 [Drepanopeziza brunnea f. sp. 'multigermtubi' MB_m1]|uniref:Uncharacterized protein n=1 Tax=Marssonina brunnea f. sp. multigermtubi (strain MB_m1) TaxID=1072389 RepID=K1WJF0_MARBU|nr:uncharacterized protein MBM_09522 [Drepanopeziza brunnea f. sp. 'multigermtubi' MB_m1]EKD12347.1 hypothetical protein MBM_09522 [Drepanopeziza brunnea f. sp. 'multigermtubi' MB_m1]
MLYKPSIIPNSRRALIVELVPNLARPKEQRLGAGADRSNRFNKFSFPGNAFRSAIKTLGSSRKDSNTLKLFRHYLVNEIEYGARPEYGFYSDDSDDGPYSDALEDYQELLLADSDALNRGNLRDMRYFDLTKLLGGKTMTIFVTLIKNGFSYKVSALLDSRANGYALIDLALLKSLSFFLKLLIQPFSALFLIKSYNGARRAIILYFALLNLTVDKRV